MAATDGPAPLRSLFSAAAAAGPAPQLPRTASLGARHGRHRERPGRQCGAGQ